MQRLMRRAKRGTSAIRTAGLLLLGLLGGMRCRCTPPPEITVLGEDSSNLAALRDFASEFQRRTGVEVKFVPKTFDQLQETANAALSHGSKAYDIILNYNFSLAPYAANNWVIPLAELKQILGSDASDWTEVENALFDSAWREVGYYRRQQTQAEEPIGYPFAANTMLLCYNKQMFDDHENQDAYREQYKTDLVVPRNWDEFRHIAEFFTDKEANTFGLALQGAAKGEWLYYEWVNFAYTFGGGVMRKRYGWEGDAFTPLLLTNPHTVKATEYYKSLARFSAGDFFSTDANQQRELMRAGNVAMTIMWSDYAYDLVFDKKRNLDRRFGFAPIPGDESMLAGGIFYIPRASAHVHEAAEFVRFVLQKNRQVEMLTHGLGSPLRTAYLDPAAQSVPYADALRHSLDRGVYMLEAGPDATAIADTITKYLQETWRNELSVQEALAEAQNEIETERTKIYHASAGK